MKKLLSIPMVAIALTLLLATGVTFGAIFIGGTGRTGEVNLQKGLVGHWKMDGDAKDASSNRNHGTVTGATLTTDRKGQSNKAYSFNGTTDYVDAGSDSRLIIGTSDFSISAWVKRASGISSSEFIVAMDGGGGTNSYELFVNSSGVFTSRIGDTPSIVSASGFTDGTWHLVVITADRDGLGTAYVDGVVSGSSIDISLGSSKNLGTGTLMIGKRGIGNPFNGQIDDVRIYNRALTLSEVEGLYDQYDPGVRVADTQKGLVGHWKLDGNALDSSFARNHGTLNGDAAVTANDRKGQANKAATFDGTGDYINYGDPSDGHLDFGTGDFAIAYWINKTNVPAGIGNQRPFSKGAVSHEVAGYAFFGSQLADGITFSISNGGGGGDGVSRINLATSAVTLGNWHHVVGQKSGTSQEVYVDGVLANSTTAPTGSTSTDKSVLFGAVNSPAELFFTGKLDDVRIYNRALSPTEITDLYESYNPVVQVADTQKGLVGHWKMDDNAKDSSFSRNHGTVTGATLTTDRKEQSNKAYSFNGTTDYVDVGDKASLEAMTTLSVEAWVKTITTGTNKAIISKWYTGNTSYILRTHPSSAGKAYFSTQTGGSSVANSESTSLINDGQWNHIVGTYDGVNQRLYVNGILEDTDPQTGTITNSEERLLFGAFDDTITGGGATTGYFNGSIDDVRIYNRALSLTEITALYESYQ